MECRVLGFNAPLTPRQAHSTWRHAVKSKVSCMVLRFFVADV